MKALTDPQGEISENSREFRTLTQGQPVRIRIDSPNDEENTDGPAIRLKEICIEPTVGLPYMHFFPSLMSSLQIAQHVHDEILSDGELPDTSAADTSRPTEDSDTDKSPESDSPPFSAQKPGRKRRVTYTRSTSSWIFLLIVYGTPRKPNRLTILGARAAEV